MISQNIPTNEIVLSRNAFNLLISAILVKYFGKSYFKMPGETSKILVLRCFFGVVAFFCGTWTLTVLPLSISFIIASLSPFITVVLSHLFLGVSIYRSDIVLMVFAYSAVVLIAFSSP